MNGPYKAASWRVEDLQALIEELTEKGLKVDVEWREGSLLKATPEQANNVRLAWEGKTFLTQQGRRGAVVLDALPPDQMRRVLTALYRRRFLAAPDFTLAIFLAVVYGLFYLGATLPALLDLGGPVLVAVSVISLAGTMVALGKARSLIAGLKAGSGSGLLWLSLPGVILHVPALLLLLPLCRGLFRQALVRRARAATGAGELHEAGA